MGISTPFNIVSTATRHALDINVTYGLSSERFNARDKYRRQYTPGQRVGAGMGVALGTGLAGLGLVAQVRNGVPHGLMKRAGVGLSVAAIAAGGWKAYQIAQDDGHLGAAGASAGVVAGMASGIFVGSKLHAGKLTPLLSGAAAVAGGIAGYKLGEQRHVGERQIDKEHKQGPNTDSSLADRAGSFVRGTFTNFTEVGPTSQGMSFGYAWGMRDTYKTKYSNSERAGAMSGDVIAAGILGGGALSVAAGLMHSQQGASGLVQAADTAGLVLRKGVGTRFIDRIGELGANKPAALGAAAATLTGYVALKEWDRAIDASGSKTTAALMAGGTVAATAGLALGISKSRAFSGQGAMAAAASSAVVAAALIGVLSSARLPVQQFVNDAKVANSIKGSTNWAVAAPVGIAGGGALGVATFKKLSTLVPNEFKFKVGPVTLGKGAIVGIGTVLGAAAGAGVGWGMSSTMPDAKKVGIAAVTGGAVGIAAGRYLPGMQSRGGQVAGLIGGALIGIATSAVLKGEDKGDVILPTGPGEVVSAASASPKYGRP